MAYALVLTKIGKVDKCGIVVGKDGFTWSQEILKYPF